MSEQRTISALAAHLGTELEKFIDLYLDREDRAKAAGEAALAAERAAGRRILDWTEQWKGEACTMTVRDCDTGEVLETRTVTSVEEQEEFFTHLYDTHDAVFRPFVTENADEDIINEDIEDPYDFGAWVANCDNEAELRELKAKFAGQSVTIAGDSL